MISVIVSSYNSTLFKQFEESVKLTIGLPYEIIRIENPGLMGICEAYNLGGEKAQFPYLCFSHEDIIFHTEKWGIKLINHFFNNKQLGIVGVAGSAYKPYVLSGWHSVWGGEMVKMSFYEGKKDSTKQTLISVNHNKEILQRVVALDGCFLCTKKSIFSFVKFDQENFKNYHCYDIDYTLAICQKYEAAVMYDVLFTHLSSGGYNKKWLDETVKLHQKWDYTLPYSALPLSKNDIYVQETGAFYFLLNKILELNYGYRYLIKLIYSKKFVKLIGFRKWLWLQVKLPKDVVNYVRKN
jgi:hypothetical protein